MKKKDKKIYLVLDHYCEVICATETLGDANTIIAETALLDENDEWTVEETTLHYWRD